MVVLLGVYSEGVVELRGGVEGAGCGVMMMLGLHVLGFWWLLIGV